MHVEGDAELEAVEQRNDQLDLAVKFCIWLVPFLKMAELVFDKKSWQGRALLTTRALLKALRFFVEIQFVESRLMERG